MHGLCVVLVLDTGGLQCTVTQTLTGSYGPTPWCSVNPRTEQGAHIAEAEAVHHLQRLQLLTPSGRPCQGHHVCVCAVDWCQLVMQAYMLYAYTWAGLVCGPFFWCCCHPCGCFPSAAGSLMLVTLAPSLCISRWVGQIVLNLTKHVSKTHRARKLQYSHAGVAEGAAAESLIKQPVFIGMG